MPSFPYLLGLFVLVASPLAAEHLRVEVPIGPRGTDVTLQLFVFDARTTTLKIIDRGGLSGPAYRNLDHAMTANRCVAGCNGGPFSRDGSPMGLVIASGAASGRPNTSDPHAEGVLFLSGSEPRIQRAKSYFQGSAKDVPPPQLLQTGPFLVENGRVASGLSSRRFGRQSFILTDGKHRWAIGYCPPATLDQLAQALADPKTFKGFSVTTALTLDGGSSTALWIRQDHLPLYLKELDPVRNFIGLVRK